MSLLIEFRIISASRYSFEEVVTKRRHNGVALSRSAVFVRGDVFVSDGESILPRMPRTARLPNSGISEIAVNGVRCGQPRPADPKWRVGVQWVLSLYSQREFQ
jgi:hypothetical protein